MDSIHLSANRSVIDGLCRLMRDMDDAEHYVYATVDIPAALYIITIARRAEDRNDYFPHGKWATIQAIEERIEKELTKIDGQIIKQRSTTEELRHSRLEP